MRHALLVLLLILPLTAGLAAAQEGDDECIILIEPSLDFRTVAVRADLVLTDEDREALRAELDADADGNITEEELRAYEVEWAHVLLRGADLRERALLVDGRPPAVVTLVRELHGWVGPTETANGIVAEVRYYQFPDQEPDKKTVALSGGLYAPPVRPGPDPVGSFVVETVVLRAPPGWVVWSVVDDTGAGNEADETGTRPPPHYVEPHEGTRYEEREVRLDDLDPSSAYIVLFARQGVDPFVVVESEDNGLFPTPAPGIALVAIALVAAVTMRGSRTRRLRP